jgi:hypothetical protein
MKGHECFRLELSDPSWPDRARSACRSHELLFHHPGADDALARNLFDFASDDPGGPANGALRRTTAPKPANGRAQQLAAAAFPIAKIRRCDNAPIALPYAKYQRKIACGSACCCRP